MRYFLFLMLLTAITGSAAAQDLGNVNTTPKDDSHIQMNPGTPDGREGGETMSDAFVIDSLPFNDTGNTSDNLNDYDAVCPYTGSTSPDVVYSFTPAGDTYVTVDMFGSTYDTKIYIMDSDQNVIACNDDFYSDYVSKIEEAYLPGGIEYFLVIDGYFLSSGDYVLAIEEFTPLPPCIVDCVGELEYEPPLEGGYVDEYNSGCNGQYHNFQTIGGNSCGPQPPYIFCGKSGWPDATSGTRDTDWFILIIGETGTLTWTLDAEQAVYGFQLAPLDCSNVAVAQQMTAGPCSPATMVVTGDPYSAVWLWVGPTDYYPPEGFVGHEFGYRSYFEGLYEFSGVTATESISFDSIKCLYR